MNKINNKYRQEAGANAIQNHMNDIDGMGAEHIGNLVKEDKECAIIDTITDILHYAESVGIKNHSDICRIAQQHIKIEGAT